MSATLRTVAKISANARLVLEERAKALNQFGSQVAEAHGEDLVGFRLEGVPYAAQMSAVERVVGRLGQVLPVAGAAAAIRGVVFLDHRSHLVVDLVPSRASSPLSCLESQPALLVRTAGTSVAIAVQPPLELLESAVVARLAGNGLLDPSVSHQVQGTLGDGTLLLSSAWLQEWLAQTLSGS